MTFEKPDKNTRICFAIFTEIKHGGEKPYNCDGCKIENDCGRLLAWEKRGAKP